MSTSSWSQNQSGTLNAKEVLGNLSQQYQVQFNYESGLLEGIKIEPNDPAKTLEQELKRIEKETFLQFSKIGSKIITVNKTKLICGYIQDVSSQMPLIGATIQSQTQNAVSLEDGYFEIQFQSKTDRIEIRFLGYKTIIRSAEFFKSNPCGIINMYSEEELISPIVLRSYLIRGIDKRADGTTIIDFSRFTTLPGLIETDVLQTVQALPGVQSVDETVSNINIRGGSHDQNLIVWDGIKMYQTGHFFGLISSFNPQITQDVSVITNGTEASYTDGVSGTLLLNTDKRIQKKFKGNIGINFISADVFLDMPIGDNSSLQLAGRKSIDDLIRTPTYEVYFDRVVQETEIAQNEANVINSNQSFSFYDTSLRWLYKPSEKDLLQINFILINNDLSFDETATVNNNNETRQSSLSQNSIGAGINYERTWNDKFSTQVSIYNTDYKLQSINANVLNEQRFLQENIVSETGSKLIGNYNFNNRLRLSGGYQFIESEITNLNDVDVPRFLRRDSEIIREHAVFIEGLYTNKNTFTVRPGFRANYIGKFNTFILEPRLSINKSLGQHLQIELLGEMKHQNASQIINFQNDFLGVERRRWQMTDNDSIPILRSKQASLGLRFNKKGWLIDATGYVKDIDGITTQSQGFTTKYEFTRTQGSYRVTGLDFLLRKNIKSLSSWISYSYMINEYTFESLEEVSFPSNFDNTHSLTLGLSYSKNSLRIAAGFNYRTGNPTTFPIPNNEILANRVNFDSANSSRLDDYMRVDTSILYNLKLSKGITAEVGGSVWNVFNQENTINNFFRIGDDGNINEFSRFSLGITTNALFRVSF